VPDCHGAKLVCMRLLGMRLLGMRLRGMRRVGLLPRLRHLWADSAYGGKLIGWVAAFAGWVLEVVRRTDQQHGPTEGGQRLRAPAALLGGGAHLRLADQVPPPRPRLRGDHTEQRGVGTPGDDKRHGP